MDPVGSGQLCQRRQHSARHLLGDSVACRGQGDPAEGEGGLRGLESDVDTLRISV